MKKPSENKPKEQKNINDLEIPPDIKKISGILKLPPDYDYKQVYRDYLEEKYLK